MATNRRAPAAWAVMVCLTTGGGTAAAADGDYSYEVETTDDQTTGHPTYRVCNDFTGWTLFRLRDDPDDDRLFIRGWFPYTTVNGEYGVDLTGQPFELQVDDQRWVIPGGNFEQVSDYHWVFRGVVGGAMLSVLVDFHHDGFVVRVRAQDINADGCISQFAGRSVTWGTSAVEGQETPYEPG